MNGYPLALPGMALPLLVICQQPGLNLIFECLCLCMPVSVTSYVYSWDSMNLCKEFQQVCIFVFTCQNNWNFQYINENSSVALNELA